MRALVIEDDPDLRQQVCGFLADEGFAVDAAPDGEQGLYMATEYRPISRSLIWAYPRPRESRSSARYVPVAAICRF